MNDVRIRAAGPDDVPGLVPLWLELMDFHSDLDPRFVRSIGAEERWAEYIAGLISNDEWLVLVAHDESGLVGYSAATVEVYPPIVVPREYGFVQEILVREAYRRGGVARRLYAQTEHWLRSRGVAQIQVKVDDVNEMSKAFWRRQGFGPHTETLVKRFEPVSI